MTTAGLPPLPISAVLPALVRGVRLAGADSAMRGLIVKGTLVAGAALLVVLLLGIWGIWTLTAGLTDGGWSEVIGWVVRIAVLGVFVVVTPVLFAMVSGLVMPFFRSRIFLRARALSGASVDDDASMLDEVRFVGVEIRRIARLVVFTVLLLPLHLIPVVGSIAHVALALLLAGHSYGWDLLGYHFELRKVPYRQQKAWIAENRPSVVALGLAGTLLCLVPIAQAFFLNTNAGAAGVLSARLDELQT